MYLCTQFFIISLNSFTSLFCFLLSLSHSKKGLMKSFPYFTKFFLPIAFISIYLMSVFLLYMIYDISLPKVYLFSIISRKLSISSRFHYYTMSFFILCGTTCYSFPQYPFCSLSLFSALEQNLFCPDLFTARCGHGLIFGQ